MHFYSIVDMLDDGSGNLYVSGGQDLLWHLDLTNDRAQIVAGDVDANAGAAVAALDLRAPTALARGVLDGRELVFCGESYFDTWTVRLLDVTDWVSLPGIGEEQRRETSVAMQADFVTGVTGLAFDAGGVLYVASTAAQQVLRVTMPTLADRGAWSIERYAGMASTPGFADGPVATARFDGLAGLAFDPSTEVLYVADRNNQVIRAVDYVTSRVALLRIDAGDDGVVSATDAVRVIYGDADGDAFPEVAARCLSAVVVVGAAQDKTLAADRCNGLLVRLQRLAVPLYNQHPTRAITCPTRGHSPRRDAQLTLMQNTTLDHMSGHGQAQFVVR